MSCYYHLTIEEREKRYGFLQKEYSIRKIAKELGRSPSTISRELKRNRDYLPFHAQKRYHERRKNGGRKCLSASNAPFNTKQLVTATYRYNQAANAYFGR